jgi:glycosyltransferase involved in cell wall biosynthesis
VKVLALAHSFPRFPGDPVGSFVLRLAVALSARGVETRVLAPMASGLAPQETFEGITVERFRYAPGRFESLAYTGTMRQQVQGSWGGWLALGGFLLAQYLRGRRAQARFRPDVIHAHWWFPGGLVGTWIAGGALPLVTTLHGSDVRLAQSVPAARAHFRRVMRRSAQVTAVSTWLARETTALVPDVHPEVAPMPIAPGLFQPGGTRARDRLLFVGKLNAQKGIGHLLRALTHMHARPLVDIVMGVGSDPTDTQALAASLGVADRLRWHPLLPQGELVQRCREGTVLVAPFVDEGLGLVAVEAHLCEMPVVAFDSGGLPDIVRHERSGLLVPPGDERALAQALDRILALPDQGAGWGKAGRLDALAAFAPEAAAGHYLQIYQRVVERARG